MGGGVCWLDYNNDGWIDLFAVNSYADVDLPHLAMPTAGCPRSALFENRHGHVHERQQARPGAGIQVKGTGCVAADLNGDGHTDLFVTTATGAELLWNNGNGTFTQGAPQPGSTRGTAGTRAASVADVNGDGRPDLFVAGYTNLACPITNSVSGFPTNYQGVRDLLYPQRGQRAERPSAVQGGRRAGRASSRPHFSHGLGAVFTDVNGDGRPDLYVANDADPNELYINEPGGPLGFHFVNEAKAYGVADPNAGMGVARGRLQRRRAARPLHHELARPAARGLPEPGAQDRGDALRPRDGEVRNRPRIAGRRSAGATRGSTSTTTASPTSSSRTAHPRHEPEEGHRADPGAARTCGDARFRRTPPGSSARRACRRSSAVASPPPTSTTTATWTSPSTRSAGRSSCSRARVRRATGSRSL